MAAKRDSHAVGLLAGVEGAGCGKRAKLQGAEPTANRRGEVEDECSALRHDLDILSKLQKLNAAYDPRLKYVSVRRLLVDFIFSVGEELSLQTITIHRSVNYLDRLLTKRMDLSRAFYQLLASACILVAAKFEEQPNNVPTLSQLANQNDGMHTKARLIEAEKLLLGELGWNALSATTLHFSQCYISLGVHCKCDTLDDGIPISPRDKAVIHKHMESLATFVCLQDYSFLKYDQALVAAAGVAAARSICNISPLWPGELAARLGYSLSDIWECFQKIIAVAKMDTKEHFSNSNELEKSGGPFSAASSVGSEADCNDSEADCKDKNGIQESSPRCATALAASW